MRPPCAAMSSGSMYRIIGPTRPVFGSPASLSPKPPRPPTGVHPVSMKNAVMKPQAMKAAMFGMIMPDRKVPNFCTAMRAPELLVAVSAVVTVCLSSPVDDRGHASVPVPRSGAPSWRSVGSHISGRQGGVQRWARSAHLSRRSGMITQLAGPASLVLSASVARRYYLDGRSKTEIADEFGLSRFKVARLIETARATGLVRIEIGHRGLIDVDLSARVQDAYGLAHAVVVDTPEGLPADVRRQLGQVAAELLAEITGPDDVLGVAWSRSVGAMARPLPRLAAVRLLRAVRAPRRSDRASPPRAAGGRPRLRAAAARHQGRRRCGALGPRPVDALRHRPRGRPGGADPAGRLRGGLRGPPHRRRRARPRRAERAGDRHRRRADARDRRGHRDPVRRGEGHGGAGRAAQRAGAGPGHPPHVRPGPARRVSPGVTEPEVPLPGGVANRGLVVRVGDTVRRPLRSTSPAAHALLRHLEDVGFAGAPRFLGVDEQGREVLSYVPGSTVLPPYPAWALTDEALVSVAELLRSYHSAVAGFDPSPYPWPTSPPASFRGELVGHNDLNLDNVVFRDGRAVALIDFDLAGPGSRVWDVACAARLWAPVRPDATIRDARRGRGLRRLRLFPDAHRGDRGGP